LKEASLWKFALPCDLILLLINQTHEQLAIGQNRKTILKIEHFAFSRRISSSCLEFMFYGSFRLNQMPLWFKSIMHLSSGRPGRLVGPMKYRYVSFTRQSTHYFVSVIVFWV